MWKGKGRVPGEGGVGCNRVMWSGWGWVAVAGDMENWKPCR